MRDNNILKAVLLLRKVGNRYTTKEEQARQEMESFSCCSARDYGPSNPWDAPGMCVSDFI